MSDPAVAKEALLAGISIERAKPMHPPPFPGEITTPTEPIFPGSPQSANTTSEVKSKRYMPAVPIEKSDLAVNSYISKCFQEIKTYFEEGCKELSLHSPQVTATFDLSNEQKFMCSLYVNGKHIHSCKIWVSRESYSATSQIGYNEGRVSSNDDSSYNDLLTISDKREKLSLQSLMGGGFWRKTTTTLDYQDLTSEQASENLWERFVSALEHCS
jgi:hypothetical protein